jgi:hypothetical protein
VNRREFIAMLGGAAALVPLTGRTQEVGRNYRVGGLSPSPRNAPHYVALFDELRRRGFIEGQNLNVDGRGYGVHNDQFVEIAVEMVKAPFFAQVMSPFSLHSGRRRRFRSSR